MINNKAELRAYYLALRNKIKPELQERLSGIILDLLENNPLFQRANSVMIYASIQSEVKTLEFIDRILSTGKKVILPYCRNNQGDLGIGGITNRKRDTVSGKFGIPEPKLKLRDNIKKEKLDLIICPGIVFDRWKTRIGYGKRYYDRFLKNVKGKTPIFALAYNIQIHPRKLPSENHDIKMDNIITESGVI